MRKRRNLPDGQGLGKLRIQLALVKQTHAFLPPVIAENRAFKALEGGTRPLNRVREYSG